MSQSRATGQSSVWFLNKTQTICGNDRETHESIETNVKTSQFAWNSAAIDHTDIPRCVVAVGREFKFPLDIEPCLELQFKVGTMGFVAGLFVDAKLIKGGFLPSSVIKL